MAQYRFKEGKGLQDYINISNQSKYLIDEIELEYLSTKNYYRLVTNLKNAPGSIRCQLLADLFEEIPNPINLIGEYGVFSDYPITESGKYTRDGYLIDILEDTKNKYLVGSNPVNSYPYFMKHYDYIKLVKNRVIEQSDK